MAEKIQKMLGALVIIRPHGEGFWGTVRPYKYERANYFCYDTVPFKTIKEVKKEIGDFCKFKKLKVVKYLSEKQYEKKKEGL